MNASQPAGNPANDPASPKFSGEFFEKDDRVNSWHLR
jgi:hypothetical protein